MHVNEIRDYLQRAPRRWSFDGGQMVNHTHVRLRWLASIAVGTLNERINRRAGLEDDWRPFHNPVIKAVQRHRRNNLRRYGLLCS
jgi:hypothetical protein